MAEAQAQPGGKGLSQPQVPHDVIAALITHSLHNLSTSPTHTDHYGGGQLNHLGEVQEELPPYESLSTKTFVIKPEHRRNCRCSSFIHPSSDWTPCRCSTGSPAFATHDGFLLFPSQLGFSSEPTSSVVSCFTDDLSHSTHCTETSSYGFSTDLPMPSPQRFKNPIRKGFCQEIHQVGTAPHSNVEDWLYQVDLDVGLTNLEGTCLQERPILTNADEQKHVENLVEEPPL